jgi:hypothetical protein
LLNEENKWDGVTECVKVEIQEGKNAVCRIQKSEVEEALRKMKVDKAAGPSGVVTEI